MPTPQPATTGYSRTPRLNREWLIAGSLVIAILLTLIPYPDWMRYAKPHWVSLVLFYWCVIAPDRVGVWLGWSVGLFLDLILHTPFGMYAIMMAFVALMGGTFHRQVQRYPLSQQCVVILALSSFQVFCIAWAFRIINEVPIELVFWQAALTSMLAWPIVHITLRFLRQRSALASKG